MDRCFLLNLLAQHFYRILFPFLKIFLLCFFLLTNSFLGDSQAQGTSAITSDGTLGTIVSSNGNVHDIAGGTRPSAGSNLFHSFEQLRLGTADVANFVNDSGLPTANILSRVTGSNPSEIFGTIQTTDFGDANLFLLNPQGIIFGPNATLNIGGSFFASTANNIELNDSSLFHAIPNEQADALLTTAPPEAFGFLSQNVASIIIDEGQLDSFSADITVLGGDVEFRGGNIRTGGGQVNIVSVASQGKVLLRATQEGLEINVDSIGQLGAIRFTDEITIDTSGGTLGERNGNVVIRGGQLLLENRAVITTVSSEELDSGSVEIQATEELIIRSGAGVAVETRGDGNAGEVFLEAPIVTIDGGVFFADSFPQESEGGNGGMINIAADRVTIKGRTGIFNGTQSTGNGGNIRIQSTDTIEIVGEELALDSSSIGVGSGGGIELIAQDVLLTDGATLTAVSNGSGQAGDVAIFAGSVTISNGAKIFLDSSGSGDAGDVRINATDSINLLGGEELGPLTEINSETRGTGNGGNIDLEAKNVTLSDSAIISTESFGPGNAGNIFMNISGTLATQEAQITSSSRSESVDAGMAGSIELRAVDTIDLSATTISTTVAGGSQPGGEIGLKANQQVVLRDGTTISATNTGAGIAGNVFIQGWENSPSIIKDGLVSHLADTIRIESSSVETSSNSALGGNIILNADFRIHLIDSALRSEVSEGQSGGNIDLDPQTIILQGNSVISTAARLQGAGGLIRIGRPGDLLFIEPSVELNVSSLSGPSGTISVGAAIQQLSESIAPLPESFLSAATIYAARCAARAEGKFSTFASGGRDALPPKPGTFLQSPLFHQIPVNTEILRQYLLPTRLGMSANTGLAEALNLINMSYTNFSSVCAS